MLPEKLNTKKKVIEALKQENILPASAMSPNYKYVVFICDGCFETHLVDEVEHILCASPTKFFFKCSGENYYGTKKTEGGFINLVSIKYKFLKGYQAQVQWYCETKLFDKAIDSL